MSGAADANTRRRSPAVSAELRRRPLAALVPGGEIGDSSEQQDQMVAGAVDRIPPADACSWRTMTPASVFGSGRDISRVQELGRKKGEENEREEGEGGKDCPSKQQADGLVLQKRVAAQDALISILLRKPPKQILTHFVILNVFSRQLIRRRCRGRIHHGLIQHLAVFVVPQLASQKDADEMFVDVVVAAQVRRLVPGLMCRGAWGRVRVGPATLPDCPLASERPDPLRHAQEIVLVEQLSGSQEMTVPLRVFGGDDLPEPQQEGCREGRNLSTHAGRADLFGDAAEGEVIVFERLDLRRPLKLGDVQRTEGEYGMQQRRAAERHHRKLVRPKALLDAWRRVGREQGRRIRREPLEDGKIGSRRADEMTEYSSGDRVHELQGQGRRPVRREHVGLLRKVGDGPHRAPLLAAGLERYDRGEPGRMVMLTGLVLDRIREDPTRGVSFIIVLRHRCVRVSIAQRRGDRQAWQQRPWCRRGHGRDVRRRSDTDTVRGIHQILGRERAYRLSILSSGGRGRFERAGVRPLR